MGAPDKVLGNGSQQYRCPRFSLGSLRDWGARIVRERPLAQHWRLNIIFFMLLSLLEELINLSGIKLQIFG
jgi:hypothetical protein